MKVFFVCLIFLHRIMAQADPGSVRICAVGDVGMGTPEQEQVAKAMLEHRCERLVLLGDIIYPVGVKNANDPILQKLFFNYYSEFKNITILLGNHDYQGNVEVWKEIASKHQNIIHPQKYFEENLNGICLLYLDTNFSHELIKTFKEIIWLIKDRSYCKIKIAFSHHPYQSSGPKHGPATGFTKFFLEQFVIGKFQYLISGHEHVLKDEGQFNGTRQILSGAGGKPMLGKPGFVILDLDLLKPEVTYRLQSITF